MASIKDALEESLADRVSWLKYVIYAIPVFVSYILFSKGIMAWFWFLAPLTALMLLTVLVQVINNVRNGKNYSLPTFNIIDFVVAYVKVIFSIVPVWGLCAWGATALAKIQIPIPVSNIQMIYAAIIWLIFGAIMVTSLISYAKTQKVLDAYNLKTISNNCIDVLIAFLFFIPQTVVLNGIILAVICYLFGVFWNLENLVFIFICAMLITINIAVTGNYLAQIDYETISRNTDA